MPRFDTRHPREARQALVTQAIAEQWTAKQAQERLAAGKLDGYSRALNVPIATVYEWLRLERKRLAALEISELADLAETEISRGMHRTLAREWTLRFASYKRRNAPLKELDHFASLALAIQKLGERLEPAKDSPAQTPKSPPNPDSEPATFRDRLAAKQTNNTTDDPIAA